MEKNDLKIEFFRSQVEQVMACGKYERTACEIFMLLYFYSRNFHVSAYTHYSGIIEWQLKFLFLTSNGNDVISFSFFSLILLPMCSREECLCVCVCECVSKSSLAEEKREEGITRENGAEDKWLQMETFQL